MGRKPNQLILEFFERGQKLDDASNRYQHTCRACGEHFAKGRIDSLTTHIVKKCPDIPLRDRQRALLQLHELPDIDSSEKSQRDGGGNRRKFGADTLVDGVAGDDDAKRRARTVQVAIPRNFTPLEALAEVTRHHEYLDTSQLSFVPVDVARDEPAPVAPPSSRHMEAQRPHWQNGSTILSSTSTIIENENGM